MNNVVSISTTTTDPNAPVPHFINPIDITKMSDEEFDTMLETIRTNRLLQHYRHNETKKLKNASYQQKLNVRYESVMLKVAKALERYDKAADALEKQINDMRALRLQLGSDPL